MPIWIRRIIFWTFIIFFFISAPLLVLYTAGYRYNIGDGQFSRTGVISITTSPRNVEIFLDGESTKMTTPEVVKRLLPGTYEIKLFKEGYHEWMSEVVVKSGQTTQLQNIQLFLDQEPELLFQKDVEIISVNPNGEIIAYTIYEGGWRETWLYMPKNNDHILVDQELDYRNTEIELSWSADGSYFSIYEIKDQLALIFDDQGKKLDTTMPSGIKSLAWHPSSDNLISISTEIGLQQIDVENGDAKLFSQTNSSSVLIDASVLSLIQGNDYTEVTQYINDEKEILALLPKNEYEIVERDETYLILTDNANQLLFIKIHEREPILLQTQAQEFEWNSESNLLAFSNGFELNIYNPELHQTELITRQSEMIESISWHPSSKVIFVQNSTLKAYETYKQAEQRVTTTIIDNADLKTVWIEKDGQSVYFYGIQDGAYGVYRLNISKTIDPF